MLNIADINFYENVPDRFEYFIHSWDTAIKISENSDYSVCTIWGIWHKKYYLISMLRKKLTYPDLKFEIEKLSQKYSPKFILIEDKASGQQLIQDLRHYKSGRIIGIKPKLDKITRFASIVHLFQNSTALLPSGYAPNAIILQELLNFPHTKHDDIVDSISQFLNFSKELSYQNLARISML